MITLRHMHRYRLALRTPIRTPGGVMSHREGVILGAEDDAQNRFVGEAAPLDGFTIETVDDVERFFSRLLNQPLPFMEDALSFTEEQRRSDWPVTVSCALETILVASLSARASLPSPPRGSRVRAYALAPTTEIAAELVERGFRSLKIKVSGQSRDEILSIISKFRAAVDDSVCFRIDANQSWSHSVASDVVTALADYGVALVEEPLSEPTPETLRAIRECSSVPVFADESVRDLADLDRWADAIDGVVIKPMFSGGPLRALDLCRNATRRGLRCFVTTALDAAVGRRMAAWTAQMMPTSDVYAHGLVTGDLLTEDVGPPLKFNGEWLGHADNSGLRTFSEEVWHRCF